ncbi:MAG: hypothetical protein ABIJ04_05085 [Bacteroidota bacterium]
MKRSKHPVDDFFKEALQEHQIQPSDAGRQRFLSEASTMKIRGWSRRIRWFLALAGLVIVSTVALLLWITDTDKEQITAMEGEMGSEQLAVGRTSSSLSSTLASDSPNQPENWSLDTPQHSDQPEDRSSDSPQSTEVHVAGTSQDISIIDTQSLAVLTSPEEPLVSTDLTHTIVSDTMFKPTSSGEQPVVDTVEVQIEKRKRARRSREWQYAMSAYFSPEWMFNTLEGDKYVSNFGLEESFRYGRYSLRTGIGLSITRGTNELMVEYNDYLGSFDQLDSISFNWDEKNYHLIPTYYLSNKEIWDSLLQLDYPKVIKRYTYLQIPLILGYDVIRKSWFSLGFRAGPILSLLMKSKTLLNDYDPGKNRIIRINQVTPDRIQTNWQIQGGINVSLHISRRFGLELEPTIKYYFNSVYEKSDATKKPWSVGFRASFSILH